MIEEKLTNEQAKLVNTIQELIDCDKKQNEFGGIIVINRRFLNEVLNLINRLKEENKELNDELDTFIHVNNKWVENWNKLLKENKELEAENERLNEKVKDLKELYTSIIKRTMEERDAILDYAENTRKATARMCHEFVETWIGDDTEECLAFCFLFAFENFIDKEFGVEIRGAK